MWVKCSYCHTLFGKCVSISSEVHEHFSTLFLTLSQIPWLSVKNWEGSFKFCCFHWLHAVLQIYAMQTWLVVHSSMFHHLNLSWIYGVFEQLMDIKQRLNPIQPQPSLSLIPLLLLSFITQFYVSLFIWITQCNTGEFFLFSLSWFLPSVSCVAASSACKSSADLLSPTTGTYSHPQKTLLLNAHLKFFFSFYLRHHGVYDFTRNKYWSGLPLPSSAVVSILDL